VATASHSNTVDQRNEEIYVPNVVFEQAGVHSTVQEISQTISTRDLTGFTVPEQKTLIDTNVEDDGLEYVLGFMARKLSVYNLGNFTYKTDQGNDHNYAAVSYVQHLSHGGLTQPTNFMLVEGRKLNAAIKSLHANDTFAFKKNIVKKTTAYLMQYTTLPAGIVVLFVKLFCKFRIKRLNRQIREQNKQINKKTKAMNKINKLTS
jgi:87kDa Transposase